jgi:uncharacterized protein (UPF0332 family)
MEDALTWFRTSQDHLRSAEDNLKIGKYHIAFQEAIYCGETLLKAVLIKNNKFSIISDKHHNIIELLKKIQKENCVDSIIMTQLADIIMNKGFGYINVTSETGSHMDCQASQAPNIRYPINGSVPNELFGYTDACEKIEQAGQLLRILSPFF